MFRDHRLSNHFGMRRQMIRFLFLFLLAVPAAAQQRFEFHPTLMEVHWIYDGKLHGEWERITGPLPAVILKQMIYDQGHWWLFTKRVSDQTGLSWQNRVILRDGDGIDVDEKGNVSAKFK